MPLNPYLNRLPVTQPGEFYGREQDVRWLLERIAYPSPQCCSVTGLRRIGKSSLLHFLAHPEGARAQYPSYFTEADKLLLAYADLSLNSPTNEDENGEEIAVQTIHHLLRVLERQARSRLPEEQAARIKGFRSASDGGWQDELEALVDSLHFLDDLDYRIIFLLDEVDIAAAWHPRLAHVLRALVMEHNIAYVTGSLHPLFELLDAEGRTSPLYNLFSTRPLGLLERGEARAMLVEPAHAAGVSWPSRLLDRLLEATGGHPDLVKMAGAHLWDVRQEHNADPSFEQVHERLQADAEALFNSICNHLTPTERSVASALAAGQNVSHASDVLASLHRRALVVESGKGYALFGRLFADWLSRQPEALQAPPAPRLEGRWLFMGGEGHQLTPTEAKLAEVLLERRGQTVTREELHRLIWDDQIPTDSKALDTAVQRLREKIEDDRTSPQWLVTVRGEGYAFK